MSKAAGQIRVLILSSWYPTARYPHAGVFVQEQARALASEGVPVAVLFVDRAPVGEWLRHTKRLQGAKEADVPVFRVPMPRVPGVWPLLYVAWAWFAYRYVRRVWGRPDILHAHVALPAGLAGAFIKRLWGTPLVITEHTGPFSFLMRNRFAAWATRHAVCSADRLVAVSTALRRQIEEYPALRRPIDIIPNVVDTEVFRLPVGHQPGTPRLLFVGEMRSSAKGVDYLLGAVSVLRKRGLEVSLDLVGEGRQRRQYETLARSLRVADLCRFLGTMPHEQLAAIMPQYSLLVMPSLAETFGVVLVEAFACGVPVVATRSGGPEGIVTPEVGVLVEPANSAALADGIADVLGRPDDFPPEQLRRSAEARFGRKAVIEMLIELYTSVLGR